MNSKILCWTALGVLILACGSPRELDTRTFQLAHLSSEDAIELLGPYLLDGKIGGIQGAVTVRETPDILAKIERVLEEFDKAPRSVTLHFQLIEANGARESDPEIAEIEAELRKLFRFEGYRLMTEASISTLEGSGINQALFDQAMNQSADFFPGYVLTGYIGTPGGQGAGEILVQVQLDAMSGHSLVAASVALGFGNTVVLGTTRLPDGKGLILTVRAEPTATSG